MNYLKLQLAQAISKKSFNLESTITESSITFPNGTQIPSSLLDRVTSIIKSRRLKPIYEQLKKWHTICLITCLIRCHIISTAITSDNLFFFFFPSPCSRDKKQARSPACIYQPRKEPSTLCLKSQLFT